MKSSHITVFLLLTIAAASAVDSAAGKDDSLKFLHQMQKEGFADIAIDYLDHVKSEPNPPAEIMRVWDLEMSRSKQAAAKIAYNDATKKQLIEDSKALMEKFVKENPALPEAIQAAAEWSADLAIQAQYEILRAQGLADKVAKSAAFAKARETLEKVRPKFVQAKDAAIKLRASLPARASNEQKDAASAQLAENRLKLAIVDFYLALIQESPAERSAQFDKVAKDFEGIHQDFSETFIGWEAHYWNARILQEQGRLKDSRDYYEEVQANDLSDLPDSTAGTKPAAKQQRPQRKKNPELEDHFFADVEQQFLKVLYAVSKSDYYKEVEDWRKAHKFNRETCVGYQGLSLDYARNLLAASDEAKSDAKKQEFRREALRVLAEMSRIPSPYQRDAFDLRRQLNPNATAEDGFDGAVIDGDKALEKRDWAAAADLYGKALEAVTPKTDPDRITAVRNAYVGCVHNQARDLYQKNKVDEAIELILAVLNKKELRATPSAPGAAAAALSWRFYQYGSAPEQSDEEKKAKQALLTKTVNLASSIIAIREWTAKEEADAARIVLLRLALIQGELADASRRAAEAKAAEAKTKGNAAEAKRSAEEAKTAAAEAKTRLDDADHVFKGINPASHKYPEALTVLGWKHWHNYRIAKKEWEEQNKTAPDKALQDQLDDDRKQAVDYTQKAVDALNVPRGNGASMPKELRDSKVLLAEMFLEGSDAKKAVGIYQELIDDIAADKANKTVDEPTLRIFDGAVRAYLQLGDVQNASAVGTKLLELGPDEVPVNMAIVNFAKRLEMVRKQVAAESDSGNTTGLSQQAIADLETKILVNLAKRNNLAPTKPRNLVPSTMIWIVQVLSKMGSDDADTAATQLVDKIFELAANDNAFDEQIGKAKAFLHTLSSKLQAKRGNYKEAIDQINALIEQYPKALAPQMSRAQILTEWAAKDAAKYEDAVNRWKILCDKLERAKTKSGDKMPEFYEAAYQRSLCLYKMSNKDKAAAREGLDFLTPLLRLDPKLQGPTRDREWSVKFFQLGGKLADVLNEPRPMPPGSRPTAPKR
jgi:hypothetical protein